MSNFTMNYNDAVNICNSTSDKIWEEIQYYQENGVDGYEDVIYELQQAYKYYAEREQHYYQYGVGLLDEGVTNGTIFIDTKIENIGNAIKQHFELDLPIDEVPVFLYRMATEVYDFMTSEPLPETGLDTIVRLPVSAVDNALNYNLPEELYTRIKEYLRIHYSEGKATVTLPNGSVYNNVVGGQYYNSIVDIAHTTFSKSWLLKTLTTAVVNCISISPVRAAAMNAVITSNIDSIYNDIHSRYQTAKGEALTRVYDFINIGNSRLVSNAYYTFEIFPVQGDSTVDYFKGDYGNDAIIDHGDNVQSIGLLHNVPSGDNVSPIIVTLRCTYNDLARNDWEYYGTNWQNTGAGSIDPHNYVWEVDYVAALRYTTYSSIANPQPTPKPAKNMTLIPLGPFYEDDVTVKGAPEPEPGAEPAPLPEPPELGGDIPYSPSETDVQTGMAAIYNPTYAQVRQLADFLWTSDFVDQVKKMFQSPIDTIISLHKVYVTPKTAGTDNIYCGFIQTDVANVKKVSNRYTFLDCGRVFIPEYYGSARDYIYSDLKVYLPFCGIMSLNINEFLGAYMHVYYNVDVLTGSCAAFVSKIVGHSEKILYTFSGNCSMQIPLSSGSYMGGFQSLLSAGASLLSGNVMGAVSGVASAATHTLEVQRSGNLTSNVGVMSPKRPYVLISRKYPNEYQRDRGLDVYRLNKPVENIQSFLAGCSAGDKVVINDFIPTARAGENPTAAELDALTAMLSQGIII